MSDEYQIPQELIDKINMLEGMVMSMSQEVIGLRAKQNAQALQKLVEDQENSIDDSGDNATPPTTKHPYFDWLRPIPAPYIEKKKGFMFVRSGAASGTIKSGTVTWGLDTVTVPDRAISVTTSATHWWLVITEPETSTATPLSADWDYGTSFPTPSTAGEIYCPIISFTLSNNVISTWKQDGIGSVCSAFHERKHPVPDATGNDHIAGSVNALVRANYSTGFWEEIAPNNTVTPMFLKSISTTNNGQPHWSQIDYPDITNPPTMLVHKLKWLTGGNYVDYKPTLTAGNFFYLAEILIHADNEDVPEDEVWFVNDQMCISYQDQ